MREREIRFLQESWLAVLKQIGFLSFVDGNIYVGFFLCENVAPSVLFCLYPNYRITTLKKKSLFFIVWLKGTVQMSSQKVNTDVHPLRNFTSKIIC